jgi:hypothetical protein
VSNWSALPNRFWFDLEFKVQKHPLPPVFTMANWNLFQTDQQTTADFPAAFRIVFAIATSQFSTRNPCQRVKTEFSDAISSDDWHVLCEWVNRPISSLISIWPKLADQSCPAICDIYLWKGPIFTF